MGCDIHIEVLLRNESKVYRVAAPPRWMSNDYKSPWTAYSHSWPEERDYAVFGKFADGVRGWHGNFPPRGVPDWVPQKTINRYEEWMAISEQCWDEGLVNLDLGDHTRSWLSMDEYFSIDWTSTYDGETVVEWPETRLTPLLKRLCEIFGKENLFLVFGFDS